MITRDLLKALGILVLGTIVLLVLLHLAGVDLERMLLGAGLFILLGGLDLIKAARP